MLREGPSHNWADDLGYDKRALYNPSIYCGLCQRGRQEGLGHQQGLVFEDTEVARTMREPAKRPDAPMPDTARPIIRAIDEGASAQTKLPTSNITI